MSYLLPHLNSGWAVDQAILSEEDRLVVIRFGHDYDPVCMQMDEVQHGPQSLSFLLLLAHCIASHSSAAACKKNRCSMA